jgi:hypothetical protein
VRDHGAAGGGGIVNALIAVMLAHPASAKHIVDANKMVFMVRLLRLVAVLWVELVGQLRA